MPVVRYQPDQVQTQTVSQPRANAASGVAAIQREAQGNIQTAQGLANLAVAGADIKQRVDTTLAEEAIVAFEKDKNDLFFNAESGYFNTQGKNAYDNASSATESLAELKKRYGDNLNSNARTMFDKSADAHIMRSESDIARHSAKGLKAWEVATVQAQVENTIENSSLYWNQPGKLRVQNALGRQAVIDASEMEGIGAEATNERLQTYDSSFAKSTINAAVSTSSAEGQSSLDKYGDRLEGHDRIKIEKMIASKTEAEKTQANSQQAIINGARIVDSFESREDIRTEVNQIDDPELRKKTMTEAMRQFNLKKQGEKEDQTEAFDRAESHIVEGGSAETYQAEDPEGWQRLSAKQKKSIEVGKAVVTDWNTYSNLMTLPKSQLANVDPTEHFHQLAPGERRSLVSAVKSANGQGSAGDKIDHQVGRTRNSQTTLAVEQILGKKNNWDDEKIQKANAFYDLLDGEVQFREQQKGSKLSSQEFTDVLSDLTREVTIEKSALGLDFLAFDEDLSVTDLPPENVRVLSKFLRDNGISVTSENLLKAQRQAGE